MSALAVELGSEVQRASLSDQQREVLNVERQALAEYFNPPHLRLENLPNLLTWLQETPSHYLAEPREWIARFLIESYRKLQTPAEKNKFTADLHNWLETDSARMVLQEINQGHSENLPELPGAIEATLERLEKLEKVQTAWFKSGASAISIGGSMSYGPFYNIKKNTPDKGGSDIDVVVVVDDPAQISTVDLKTNLSTLGSSPEEVTALVTEWEKCWANPESGNDIFTSKLMVAGNKETFEISFHVFCGIAYDRLTNPETANDNTLVAYRTRPFKHAPVHTSLAGERVPLQIANTQLNEGAYAMSMNTWPRDSRGVFAPNMYHNMILPNADVAFNSEISSPAQDNTNRFLNHVYQNLELADVALSHLRAEIISPFLHYHLRNKQV